MALLLLYIFLLSLPILLLCRRLGTHKQLDAPLPPNPRGIPILGNLHQLGSLPHRSLRTLADKHGPLMLIHLGQVPTLIVSSSEVAREITQNHDLIFSSRPPLKVAETLFYGTLDMAFAPYGEYWRNVRKVCVSHLLSPKMVQSFQYIREEEVAILIDYVSSRGSSVINMSGALMTFSNDYLCRVVSRRFSDDEGRKKMIRRLIQEVSDHIGTFRVGDYIPYLGWVDAFLGLDAQARMTAKEWDDVLEEAIEDKGNKSKGDGVEDFVDVLLNLQKDPNVGFKLTRNSIKALLMNMLAAGTDPPYITLEWAMTELVRNPQVMKRLQDEVREKVKGNLMIREEDLSQMSYLKSVIKEVLRLHPPAPLLVPRELTENCYIKGYEIPGKTRVIVNAWAIGRDPNIWEAPEEFRPERFLNSPLDFKGKEFQFIPFGMGRRMCPGMTFSIAIVELTLANLVSQFEWKLPDGMTIETIDMIEAPGLATRKKQELNLVAKSYSC
uniref:Cytochrome P450 71A1 n=1 Tax=Fritillaria cirrhosa TaxID=108544 RepID=A0A1L7H7V3_9LILI|nr:cytochrome P450 71A1 [Fritillaria cirrhosa]